MKKITLLLLLAFSLQNYGQNAPNTSCETAITLFPGNNYATGSVYSTLLGAPNDGGTSQCNSFVYHDVWYKVMVPASGHLYIETNNSVSNPVNDTVLTVYEVDNCDSFLFVACNDDIDSDSNLNSYLSLTIQPYTWIYIVVQKVGSALTTANCNFYLSVYDPSIILPAPGNNNCSGAVSMPVATSYAAGAQAKTFLAATTTTDDTLLPACTTQSFSDIWFKAVVPATGNLTVETKTAATNSETDTVLTVYTGTCNSLVVIGCNDDKTTTDSMSKVSLTGLVPGTTVYIAAWRYYIDTPAVTDSNFQLSVYDLSVAPANDNCTGAFTLIPAQNYEAGRVQGTLFNGSKSVGVTASCATTSTDVWYKLVVPPSGNVTIETTHYSQGIEDTVLAVYSGSCGAFTQIACNDNRSTGVLTSLVNVTGQVPGSTIYVMVAKWGTIPAEVNTSIFGISAYDISTSPVNDNCSGAITLTVKNNFALAASQQTMLFATNSPYAPLCQSSSNFDVWYKVIVPASGSLTIETRVAATNSATDTAVAAYSGNCGAITLVGCDNDGGPFGVNDQMSLLALDGLTPGSILRIVVGETGAFWNNTAVANFVIGVYDPSVLADDTFDSADFRAYPNPVKDILNLSYDKEISDVAVFNLLGQQVITKSPHTKEAHIDLSALASGTYIVKITSEQLTKTLKVFKE